MPTATITTLYCVKEATGTDLQGPLNDAVVALVKAAIPDNPSPAALLNIRGFLSTVPGLIAAIDSVRSDPDNLYVTRETEGGVDNRLWPQPPSKTKDMQAFQSNDLNISLSFLNSLNISLWDHDPVSADDLLGSITISKNEAGLGERTQRAYSLIEGSFYYIVYKVV